MTTKTFFDILSLELISVFQPNQFTLSIEEKVSWIFIDLSVGRLALLLSNATPGTFSIYGSEMPEDIELIICGIVNNLFHNACKNFYGD